MLETAKERNVSLYYIWIKKFYWRQENNNFVKHLSFAQKIIFLLLFIIQRNVQMEFVELSLSYIQRNITIILLAPRARILPAYVWLAPCANPRVHMKDRSAFWYELM